MSEFACLHPSLSEVLNPRNTPEMGFQSYEMLGGDAAVREQQKVAFLRGEVINPTLDYPKLDAPALQKGISNLDSILSLADAQDDPEVRATVWDSAAYRMAEMYWLQSSEDLIRTHPRRTSQEIDAKVVRTQELNEQLYGKPEEAITDALLSEVWSQMDTRNHSGEAANLKAELEDGCTTEIADKQVVVDALRRSTSERLPQIPDSLLEGLKEKLLSDNDDILELINNYWNTVVQQRADDERKFTPNDMLEVFTQVHALRDPENTSGVRVIMDPDATALSWETPLMAVVIGGQRGPINNPTTMFAKVIHEYVIHGGRCVAGSKTDMPVLGTGVFSEADPGENSDYLTFEEGFASMGEMTITDKKVGWTPSNIDKTLALTLAYEGRDFRQIYETLWRVRALMSNDTLDGTVIAKAKNAAYASTLRVLRGTPTELSRQGTNEPRILTFNKDLAYLKGKLQMIEFWDEYGQDPEMVDLIFKGKFDPLNKRQLSVAKNAFND